MNNIDTNVIKRQFQIIGEHPLLIQSLRTAALVAPTDISVLITGESGTGKEIIPQIIHQYSLRKQKPYIAVNCGAIPDGTIDSELFGHEKGAFTSASEQRKGYFEVASSGTIFLDEVGELPLSTQVRLLRVLETGEFIRVGSSKVLHTDVRIVAATNVNLPEAISHGKFREDLYYRLNMVSITLPPLRSRMHDIPLLFRKFARDFADKYNMPAVHLSDEAIPILVKFPWPGNIRQLKNLTEQLSILAPEREISAEILSQFLPQQISCLPVQSAPQNEKTFASEREILYKILFDLRNDVNNLKAMMQTTQTNMPHNQDDTQSPIISHVIPQVFPQSLPTKTEKKENTIYIDTIDDRTSENKPMSLAEHERKIIAEVLKKHNGRRKAAAEELGITERTLYRKIKEIDQNFPK